MQAKDTFALLSSICSERMLMGTQEYDEGCLMLIARNLLGLILRELQGHDADVP